MYIYTITPERFSPFAHLAGDRTAAALERGELLALGAVLEEKGDAPRAAGLLCFAADEGVAEIRWLYVAEDCRRRGCATALLHRLLDTLFLTEDLCSAVLTLPAEEEFTPLEELLEEVGFENRTAPEAAEQKLHTWSLSLDDGLLSREEEE